MPRVTPALLAAATCVLMLSQYAVADIYMHNPAGSNNRNRERQANRNNANRLFDSQNNGAGGYPWRGNRRARGEPDPMVYYEGSKLRLEWTMQHACGSNPNVHCQVIVQYACEDTMPSLRDGYPTGDLAELADGYRHATFTSNNAAGTTTITEATRDNVEFGMHENSTYYQACRFRRRNGGLYTADRRLQQQSALHTRQNPNGARHGFECPEERDYYPYWHPTPWRDAAILVSNTAWCEYYRQHSENVMDRWFCFMDTATRQAVPGQLTPINEGECRAHGGEWRRRPAFGISPPTCMQHPFGSDNHLGNTVMAPTEGQSEAHPDMPHYWWTVPQLPPLQGDSDGLLCVLRMRYNISTNDFPSMAAMSEEEVRQGRSVFDHRYNCPRVVETGRTEEGDEQRVAGGATDDGCVNRLMDGNRPRYNRPYVQVFADENSPRLSVALNTDQAGRTFQDRSYVFKIQRRPNNVPAGARIWNLNTRGKRGNIVQTFPSVEYDFVPNELAVHQGDYLHIQWTGSDYNVARNANDAEGWRHSDRFNMVQVDDRNHQIPLPAALVTMFPDEAATRRFALLGQTNCGTFVAGQNNEQNDPSNCGKLNAAPAHFDGGLMRVAIPPGTYSYISTRNNNFSNRSQKGSITVVGRDTSSSAGVIIGVVVGVVAVAGLVGFAYYKGWVRLPRRSPSRPTARPAPMPTPGAEMAPPAAPARRAPPPPPRPGTNAMAMI